jgi:hypothetical protein
VATAGAVAVAGVTIAAISITDDTDSGELPRDVAIVEAWTDWWVLDAEGLVDPPPLTPLVLDSQTRDSIERLLPDATWITLRAAGIDPRPFDPDDGPSAESAPAARPGEVRFEAHVATIADPELLALAGISAADQARLADVDLLEFEPWRTPGEVASINGGGPGSEVLLTGATGDIVASRAVTTNGLGSQRFPVLMSTDRAEALGLDVVETAVLLLNPTDLTDTQRRELGYLTSGDDERIGFVAPGDPQPRTDGEVDAPRSGLTIQIAYDTQQLPIALINTIIVALAVLFTLLVVAIGLSLSATESRDERDVLVAVGAPPKTLTRVAGAKAFTLAATGVILAVPTGFLPTWVVYRTVDDQPVQFPWVAVGLLVLVVPLAAGIATWAASAAAQTIRPMRMSTAFTE